MSEINKEFERGYDSAKQFMQSKLNACEKLLQAERDRSEKFLKNLEDIIDGRVKLDAQYTVEAQLAEERGRSEKLLATLRKVYPMYGRQEISEARNIISWAIAAHEKSQAGGG